MTKPITREEVMGFAGSERFLALFERAESAERERDHLRNQLLEQSDAINRLVAERDELRKDTDDLCEVSAGMAIATCALMIRGAEAPTGVIKEALAVRDEMMQLGYEKEMSRLKDDRSFAGWVDDLCARPWGSRLRNALETLDVRTFSDFERLSREDFLALPNFGRTTLYWLIDGLSERGVKLKKKRTPTAVGE